MELTFFLLGVTAAAIVAWRYNLRYSRAARALQMVFKNEGLEWIYVSHTKFLIMILLRPSSLVKAEDTVAVAAAKQELLSVRNSMPKVILRGILCLVLGIAAGIGFGLLSFYLKR